MKPRLWIISSKSQDWTRVDAEVTATPDVHPTHAVRGPFAGIVLVIDHVPQLDRLDSIRKAYPDTPVVVLSPDDRSEVLEEARRRGADAAFRDHGAFERNTDLVLRVIETLRGSRLAQKLAAYSESIWQQIDKVARSNRALLRRTRAVVAGPDPYPILVADDDENSCMLLERGFRKAGLPAFLRVNDGLEAMGYLKGEGDFADRTAFPLPSLLILDYHMARMNGLEVLRWMKRRPELLEIPVIMLSFSEDPGVVAQATSEGANAYLVKPLTIEQWTRTAEVIRGYRELALSIA